MSEVKEMVGLNFFTKSVKLLKVLLCYVCQTNTMFIKGKDRTFIRYHDQMFK